jgi:hypothetical protein
MDLAGSQPESVPVDRPFLAIAISTVIAAVVYVGIQLVTGGQVDPLETAVFVLVFTGIYVGLVRVQHRLTG